MLLLLDPRGTQIQRNCRAARHPGKYHLGFRGALARGARHLLQECYYSAPQGPNLQLVLRVTASLLNVVLDKGPNFGDPSPRRLVEILALRKLC